MIEGADKDALLQQGHVGTKLHSADVSNAYFQSEPSHRVLLLRQPRGGLPQVDPNAALLVGVPVRGLTASGRSFWLRLSSDAKKAGLTPSIIYPELLLGSYELGSLEDTNFRYCGKAFGEQNATLSTHKG